MFQLTEEEKQRIYEPLVIVDQNTNDSLELDENQSDNDLSSRKAPVTSIQCGEEEEENEAVEEDALEEQRRDVCSLEKDNPSQEPFADPTFQIKDTLEDDPLFEEEEKDDTAVVSLIPTVATTRKKKPSFRSLRTKRKK